MSQKGGTFVTKTYMSVKRRGTFMGENKLKGLGNVNFFNIWKEWLPWDSLNF